MMKIVPVMFCLLIFAVSFPAQTDVVPIVEMSSGGGLLGGVRDGKWIKPEDFAAGLKPEIELVLVGPKGVEEGGVTLAKRGEEWGACPDLVHFDLELKMDEGVALGSGAKWNPVPRVPKEINLPSGVYTKHFADFLKSKGLPAKTPGKLTQAFQVDLDADGTQEVVISATFYKKGPEELASRGDYSVVLVRKIVNGKAQNILLTGEIITKPVSDGTTNEYRISSIADLNGDGRMEIVTSARYYEGNWQGVYELKGDKFEKVLEIECIV
jgi:hypothetical protein